MERTYGLPAAARTHCERAPLEHILWSKSSLQMTPSPADSRVLPGSEGRADESISSLFVSVPRYFLGEPGLIYTKEKSGGPIRVFEIRKLSYKSCNKRACYLEHTIKLKWNETIYLLDCVNTKMYTFWNSHSRRRSV